jgi:hypothetical protein
MFSKLPLKIFLALVVVALAGCYGIRCIVFIKLENKLPQLLQDLEQRNITAKVQSIETSWYDNRITLKGISLSNAEPSSLPLSISDASISSLTVTGIQLLPLLFNKDIKLDSVLIGKVKLTKYNTTKSAKNATKERSFELSYIRIDSLEVTQLDSADKVLSNTKLSFETRNLHGTIPLTDVYTEVLLVSGMQMKFPESNYLIKFDEARLENMNHFEVDSLKIIPLYPKAEFVKRVGYETDRLDCVFPTIELDGINYKSILNDNTLAIHQVSLSFLISVYRDKRIKDMKKYKPLPDSLLRKLPFAVLIDSIKVDNSQLIYEEVAESAETSGKVHFRQLNATIYDISNRAEKAMHLRADAQFMNDGEISIRGNFSNTDKPHFLEGSLRNFRLTRINQMLMPATGISVESGKLDLMKFTFWYNNTHSDGELVLNYHDLKLLSSHQNKENKTVPNVVKTLLINAFIENDLDKNDSRAKRQGDIHFVRDQNKFIFNFWWKSLLSGLKSASGVPAPKDDKGVTAKKRNRKKESAS